MAILFEEDEQGKMPAEETTDSGKGRALPRALTEAFLNQLGSLATRGASQLLPESFSKGFGHSVPRTALSGVRGASQLLGYDAIPEIQQKTPESAGELVGQLAGQGLTYGAMTAPFVAGAEAAFPAAIPEIIPALTGATAAGATLSPKGERLRGAAEFGGGVAALKALQPFAGFTAKSLKAALRKVNPEETYGKIQNQYDRIKESLQDIFGFVEKQAEERGIKNVKELDDDVFSNAREYGPKTKSFKRLVDRAETGDYPAVRRLYSELGKRAQKAESAQDWEKKEIFDEIQEMINEGLAEHFKNTGHSDLSQWLDAAKRGWSDMKKMYEDNTTIRKLVGANREVPETLKPLTKNAVDIKRLRQAHPEVDKDIEAQLQKEAFKKAFKKAKERGITATSLAALGKFLKQDDRPSYDYQSR